MSFGSNYGKRPTLWVLAVIAAAAIVPMLQSASGQRVASASPPLRAADPLDEIAYSSNWNRNYDLYLTNVLDAVGNAKTPAPPPGRNLTNTPDVDETCPTWSPDGRRLAFVVNGLDIFSMSVVGKPQRTRLTHGKDPSWSPRGDFIAFTDTKGGTWDIWLYDVARRQAIQLTNDAGSEMQPCWSPDATRIAYVYTPAAGGPAEIRTIRAEGGPSTILAGGRHPTWSLMDRIAFVWNDGRSNGLYDVSLQGEPRRQALRHSRWNDSSPAYSPDCTRLAFGSVPTGLPDDAGLGGADDIYIIPATGAPPVWRLTNTVGVRDIDPAWRPRIRARDREE
jgi:Tol biopolymer transport system component